jgi:hypothetical protein
LFYETIDLAQTKTRALASLLCGEERIKCSIESLLIRADASVSDRNANVPQVSTVARFARLYIVVNVSGIE